MSRPSSRSSRRPDRVRGVGSLSSGLPRPLKRFSATTERLRMRRFFALKEGQPSGWPSRIFRTVGRGGHPEGRNGVEDPRSGLTAAVDRARGRHAPSAARALPNGGESFSCCRYQPRAYRDARLQTTPNALLNSPSPTRNPTRSRAAWLWPDVRMSGQPRRNG